MKQYFGKYRGKVTQNKDPLRLGRIQITVPSVLGEGKLSWAMPCVAYAGKEVGYYAIPPLQANIWVEFEGGDLDYPIWSGCFWGKEELPKEVEEGAEEQTKLFKTESLSLLFNDKQNAGGITLEVKSPVVASPLKITMNSQGITIDGSQEKVNLKGSPVLANNKKIG